MARESRRGFCWVASVASWVVLAAFLAGCGPKAPITVQDVPDGKPAPAEAGEARPCMPEAMNGAGGAAEPCHEHEGAMPCEHGSEKPCDHQASASGGCGEHGKPGIRWIDLGMLAATLPKAPIDVVFDIDDTVLFTSPGFQWGARVYGEEIVKAGATTREEDLPSDEARRKFHEFWSKMNTELDQWSVKKWIAGELIKLHKSRGDRIHFVTKRVKTGSEKVTELISRTFDLKGMEPVLFTDRTSKTPFFQKVHAQVSYGDSDGDIRESIAAGARPIRVERARNSVNEDPTHDGAFGEEVLIDSQN